MGDIFTDRLNRLPDPAPQEFRKLVVYQTFRNSDMNEGRGLMVPDLAFTKRDYAARYIDSKQGVQGLRKKWSEERFGDWKIQELEVLDHDVVSSQEEMERVKKEALAKLTPYERKALGL